MSAKASANAIEPFGSGILDCKVFYGQNGLVLVTPGMEKYGRTTRNLVCNIDVPPQEFNKNLLAECRLPLKDLLNQYNVEVCTLFSGGLVHDHVT